MSTDSETLTLRMKLLGNKEAARGYDEVRDASGRLRDEQGRFVKSSEQAATGFESSMKRIGDWGDKTRERGKRMTLGMTLPLLGLGALSVNAAGDFERSMAQVRVATNAPERVLGRLSETAKTLGADTKFSAGEAAEAILELAKSGMTPAQIQGGALKSAMDLAAAGNIGLAESATLTGAAMNSFELQAGKAKEIADALAGGANASAADVSDLSQALSQGGVGAASYGLSLQEAVGALGAFSEAGIRGSDAGTSFKTFLARLNPETKKARELMQALGLDFFDAAGNMKTLPAVAGELKGKLSGFTSEERQGFMQTLFGSDAIRASNVFYKEGAEGIAKFTRATEKQGSASKMANAFMEGSAGKIEEAKGAMDNAAIAAGVALAPAVVMLADAVSHLMEWFTALPEPVQEFIVAGAGILAIAGPLLMFLGAAATGVSALGAALAFLAANPVVLVIAGIVALGAGLYVAYHKVGWFRDAVDWVTDALGGAANAVAFFLRFVTPIGAMAVLVVGHLDSISAAFNWVKTAAQNVMDWFSNSTLGQILSAPFQFMVTKVELAIDAIKTIVGAFEEAISLVEGSGTVKDSSIHPKTKPVPGAGYNPDIPHGTGLPPPAAGAAPGKPPRSSGSRAGRAQGSPRRNLLGSAESQAGQKIIKLYASPDSQTSIATWVLDEADDVAALQ